jgi:hypothetical protein
MSDPVDRGPTNRRYRRDGYDVDIAEGPDTVTLSLNGHAVDVAVIDGKYHSALAHPFVAFDDIDQIVDRLVAGEGRTWRMAHAHPPHPHEKPKPEPGPGHGSGHDEHGGGQP